MEGVRGVLVDNPKEVVVIDSLRRSEHQVAGHGCAGEKLGPVIDDAGIFYKPLQNDDRGHREATFYRRVATEASTQAEGCSDNCRPLCGSTCGAGSTTSLAFLSRYIPDSYGTCSINLEHFAGSRDPVTCLMMEDITHSYTRPCVMDLKMGYRTWYHGAPDKKVAEWRKKDASSTSPLMGFKISGMQVYHTQHNGYKRFPKQWCKSISSCEELCHALRVFVHDVPSPTPSGPSQSQEATEARPAHSVCEQVYGSIVKELCCLEKWFAQQDLMHFCSTSLLLVYEGMHHPQGERAGADALRVRVCLVDFAHTMPPGEKGVDHNFLEGLRSLIATLQNLLRKDGHTVANCNMSSS